MTDETADRRISSPGRRVATAVAEDLIGMGVVVPKRNGGLRRERLIRRIESIASQCIGNVDRNEELQPVEEVYYRLSVPLLKLRGWLYSQPPTPQRAGAIDSIDHALLVAGKIASRPAPEPTSD